MRRAVKGGFRSWLDRFECLEGNEATARELRAMLPGMLVEQVAAVFLELVNVFVSGFFSTAAMAGVGQINTVNSVLMNLFQAFAIGGTAIVSQHAGAARRGEAARNAFSALTLGLTVSVVITALIFSLRGEFVMLLFGDAEAEVIASSNVYFGFTALAPPLWFIYFQCCGFMRATGDTKRPMYVSIVLNVSSLALNLALTFALDMGVTGTALSYLLSLAIAAALSLAMVLRRGFELRPKRCGAGELAANIRAITAISVPSSAENLMFNGSRIVLQSFLAGMGAAMISGNSVFNSVNGIFNVPVMALYYLTIPIVGRCAGEGDCERVSRALKFMVRKNLVWSVPVALCHLLLGIPFSLIFSRDWEVVVVAAGMLAIYSPFALMQDGSFILPNGFKAVGDAKFAMVVSSCTAWIVRVLGTWILGVRLGWGAYAIALTQGVDTAIRSALYHARFRRGTWLKYMFPEKK